MNTHWRQVIEEAVKPLRVLQSAPIEELSGSSEPVLLNCEDCQRYVLKGKRASRGTRRRGMVNDWVVGLVGRIIDAPVAEPRVVELAQDMPPKLARLGWAPGVYFASRWVPNEPILDYQQAVAEAAKQEGNRFPLALLAVLWAAFFAKDGQLVRRSDGSAMLTSIDHDLFFPGGADWSFNDLEHPRSHPNWKRPFRCKDLAAHLAPAVNALKAIEKEAFSEVVKGVPQQWGLDDRDRIALRKFLENLPTFETDVNSWNSEADL